jgi:NADPH-dependent 2,4-dienoyl-CoA reductase/sulfur reductase-like enzyme
VDLIHVSAGHHEVPEVYTVTHPSLFLTEGANLEYAVAIKKEVETPVATVGAFSDPEFMEATLESGKADIIECARALIADPDLPRKARAGKSDEIRPCMRCLACFSSLVDKGEFNCAANPMAGHELEPEPAPLRGRVSGVRAKRVLIAGGGVAGMQAAITCAQLGMSVALYEKSGRLGGTLLCEEAVPFKSLLAKYIDYQIRQVEKSGADIHMGEALTPEIAYELAPDAIIAALGAEAARPSIPGIDGPNVLPAELAYTKPESVGERVLILGAGLVGIELAIYLSMLGKSVEIAEMADALNHGGNHMHARSLPVQIEKHGIGIHYRSKAVRIGAEGVYCVDARGGEAFYEADTIVYAVGQRALRDEALALAACAPEFHIIGDCLEPKSILSATSQAFQTAKNIGRAL